MVDEYRYVEIAGAVKVILHNRLKYATGDLLRILTQLDHQQQEYYAEGNQDALQPGIFEKKCLEECDKAFISILGMTLKELSDGYHHRHRQDPMEFWACVKKAVFTLWEEEEKQIQKRFMSYVKSLNYGNFSGSKCIHIDVESVVIDWVQEYRRKSHFEELSTPQERQNLMVSDVVLVSGYAEKGSLPEERLQDYESLVKTYRQSSKRLSENHCTFDCLENLYTIAEPRRGDLVEKWLSKSPIVIVDLSTLSAAAFMAYGLRRGMNVCVLAFCHEKSFNQSAFDLTLWPVTLYKDLDDLRAKVSVELYEAFQMIEFSGDPGIIL